MNEMLQRLRLAREQKDERGFLGIACNGDAGAVRFILDLAAISQVWDDLVDLDKPVSPEQINDCFVRALVELPRNPFYGQHFGLLQPLLASAIQCWLDANVLQKTDRHGRVLAFVLRDRLADIVSACAGITGGSAWQRAASPEIRLYNHDETLGEYVRGLRKGAS